MLDVASLVTLAVYSAICLALVFFVLLQKGEGGIGSALGGQAVEKALGARSAAAWKKVTAACAVLFVVLTVVLGELVHRDWVASVAQTATGQ